MYKTVLFLAAAVSLCQFAAEPALAQKGKAPRPVANASSARNSVDEAQAELMKGNDAFDRKEWAKAIKHYTTALQLKSDLLPALLNRGRANLFAGKLDDAIADLQKVCESNPNLSAAHAFLGAAYLDKGNHSAAIDAAGKSLKLDAKQAFALYIRGTALIHRGEFARAIDDLNEAANLCPEDSVIYNNRGIAWQKSGDEKKAQADFERRDFLLKKANGENNETLSPAKRIARDRVKEAEEQYKAINLLVEAHENRIRTQQSIRVPPGVRRPVIDPVPTELLQRRAAAWIALQEAVRLFKETP